jgi:tRNA-dihydrouridine synthase A
VDGVMLGRVAYHNPWILVECEQYLAPGLVAPQREEIVHSMVEYCRRQVALGIPVKHISRHMLGLFQGLPGARRWRRWISENAHRHDANHCLLDQALQHYLVASRHLDAA